MPSTNNQIQEEEKRTPIGLRIEAQKKIKESEEILENIKKKRKQKNTLEMIINNAFLNNEKTKELIKNLKDFQQKRVEKLLNSQKNLKGKNQKNEKKSLLT